ncbi:hypothetical protein R80B4_02609 [Fibrobacteres bacterium R8-0-B4]
MLRLCLIHVLPPIVTDSYEAEPPPLPPRSVPGDAPHAVPVSCGIALFSLRFASWALVLVSTPGAEQVAGVVVTQGPHVSASHAVPVSCAIGLVSLCVASLTLVLVSMPAA